MRDIMLARLDKTRPVLVLTRDQVREAMSRVTVAPITSTIKGLSTEVPVGPRNGIDGDSVADAATTSSRSAAASSVARSVTCTTTRRRC